MDKILFNNAVVYAVEIEYEMGGRNWYEVKGTDLDEFLKLHKNELSDLDYAYHQENAEVRHILNLAYYNWRNNYDWAKKKGFTSIDDVIDYIIENKLYERK